MLNPIESARYFSKPKKFGDFGDVDLSSELQKPFGHWQKEPAARGFFGQKGKKRIGVDPRWKEPEATHDPFADTSVVEGTYTPINKSGEKIVVNSGSRGTSVEEIFRAARQSTADAITRETHEAIDRYDAAVSSLGVPKSQPSTENHGHGWEYYQEGRDAAGGDPGNE